MSLLLYDNPVSGNAYKVRLLLAHLQLPYERVEVSVTDRTNRQELFAGKNPSLRIPVLRLEDGTHLGESNAILWYLAEGTRFLAEGRLERARLLQWMFFEQYDHEPNIAVARYLLHYAPDAGQHAEIVAARQQGGRRALAAMERHLKQHCYFVDERFTIADIALYAYTHVADEAGIGLGDYPSVGNWLRRVAAEPGHAALLS